MANLYLSDFFPIPGYSKYIIDKNGIVISLPKNNKMGRPQRFHLIMKTHIGRGGYVKIGLSKNSVSKPLLLARLVAQTFIPNPHNKPQVNHINGIKTDNRVDNLEWVTAQENIIHSFKILNKKAPFKNKKGKEHPVSKKLYN